MSPPTRPLPSSERRGIAWPVNGSREKERERLNGRLSEQVNSTTTQHSSTRVHSPSRFFCWALAQRPTHGLAPLAQQKADGEERSAPLLDAEPVQSRGRAHKHILSLLICTYIYICIFAVSVFCVCCYFILSRSPPSFSAFVFPLFSPGAASPSPSLQRPPAEHNSGHLRTKRPTGAEH